MAQCGQTLANISCMIPFLRHVHNTSMQTERKMAARGWRARQMESDG